MRVEWYGQSAFHLSAGGHSVAIDPFADMSALAASRGMQFDYPPIEGVQAELLLVTHEHIDHNGVGSIGGDPVILRSTAGTLESPLGTVTAIASEHDDQAGVARGPNTIFAFELDGHRVCHFGDFGQRALRDEQAAAIGFLETADAFLERSGRVERLAASSFETSELPLSDGPLVVVPAAP